MTRPVTDVRLPAPRQRFAVLGAAHAARDRPARTPIAHAYRVKGRSDRFGPPSRIIRRWRRRCSLLGRIVRLRWELRRRLRRFPPEIAIAARYVVSFGQGVTAEVVRFADDRHRI